MAARIDATIGKLPGLAGFDQLTRSHEDSLARLGMIEPALSAVIAAEGLVAKEPCDPRPVGGVKTADNLVA